MEEERIVRSKDLPKLCKINQGFSYSETNIPKASWVPVAFLLCQLAFCPALALGCTSLSQIRSLQYHHPSLAPPLSNSNLFSSGLFVPGFWMLGEWAVLNQPIPANPGCLLLAWESSQDESGISLVQRGIIIGLQSMGT